jgi:multiple sugar transport system ATP-binding protein
VVTDDTKLIAEESGEGELYIGADEGIKCVASFAPRSRVRTGDEIEIAVDVERAHFFDPQTSETIRA